MFRPRKRVALFLLVLAGALGLTGSVALAAFGPRRAARAARAFWRLKHGRTHAYDLVVLGRNAPKLGIVQRTIEDRLDDPDPEVRRDALMGLARGFPESRVGRAIREFEALTGENYFGGWNKTSGGAFRGRGAKATIPLGEAIVRWKALCDDYPDFSGRDDAGIHLARCQEEAGDARGALLTLLAARSWGDEDSRFLIEDRIANVLDAQLSLEDTQNLASGTKNALLLYSAAVKLARAHRFADAVAWTDGFFLAARSGSVDLLGHAPAYFVWRDEKGVPVTRFDGFLADVKRQRALWERLANGDLLAPEALLEEPHAFQNLVLHESVKTDRAGKPAPESQDAVFVAYCRERNHLVQAAAIFSAVAAVDSSARLRALSGIARARIGLVGYWGSAPGHDLPDPIEGRAHAAECAVRDLVAAASESELPGALEAIDGAITSWRVGSWAYRPAKIFRTRLRLAARAEENHRGR
ncbi:MAG TPA: hypothetical protein VFF73_07170 [Planctomycetota bacterium]|nr:hypothetical protein [Planctomycetota bacterium]